MERRAGRQHGDVPGQLCQGETFLIVLRVRGELERRESSQLFAGVVQPQPLPGLARLVRLPDLLRWELTFPGRDHFSGPFSVSLGQSLSVSLSVNESVRVNRETCLVAESASWAGWGWLPLGHSGCESVALPLPPAQDQDGGHHVQPLLLLPVFPRHLQASVPAEPVRPSLCEGRSVPAS